MVLSKIVLAVAAVAVAAPADISAPHECFPSNTQTLISDFELRSVNMQYGLAQGNDSAGKQAHTEMKDLLDMISGEVNALGNCENNLPAAWPKQLSAEDSKDRALELLQQANKEMELLRDPVAKCDHAGALKKVCDARSVVDEIDLYPGYLNVQARQTANCSWSDYGDTMSLLQNTESAVSYLRIDVEFDDKAGIKTNFGPMNQKMDELSVAVGAGQHGDICNNPRPKPWPKMKSKKSRDRAVELLNSVHNNLGLLEKLVEKCERPKALVSYCRERAVIDHVNLWPGFAEDLTARSEECFPKMTGEFITWLQTDMMNARHYFSSTYGTADQETAKEDMAGANELLGAISEAMGVGPNGEQCHNPFPQAWPNMPSNDSAAIASEFLNTAEKEMDGVWHLVRDCSRTDAVQKFCLAKSLMDNVNLYPGFSGQPEARSEECFPNDTGDKIKQFQVKLIDVLHSLEDDDNKAGKQAIGLLNQALGNLSIAIGAGDVDQVCRRTPAHA